MFSQIMLIAAGVIACLFGLLFLFAPDQATRNFQLGESTTASRLFSRSTGCGLISVGIINILASGDSGSSALYALVIGNIVLHVLGIAVDFTEDFPKKGGWWVGFIVHIVFIVGFGYVLLSWPPVAAATAA